MSRKDTRMKNTNTKPSWDYDDNKDHDRKKTRDKRKSRERKRDVS